MDNQPIPNFNIRTVDLIVLGITLVTLVAISWIGAYVYAHTYTPPDCCAHGHPHKLVVTHDVAPPGKLSSNNLTRDGNSNNTNSTNSPGGGIVLCK